MTLAARTQALLDLVEADRAAQCGMLAAQAEAAAAALLAQARGEARRLVRAALAEERTRARERLAAASAEWQTRQRLHEQGRIEALLAQGWELLPSALLHRWMDAGARALWVEFARTRALELLPRRDWQVEHGDSWPAAERDLLAERVHRDLGAAPRFLQRTELVAGLRIAAAGNIVDATLHGLIADRDEIGGRLIGLLEGFE